MPRAKLPQPIDSEDILRRRVAVFLPQFEERVRQNANLSATLGCDPPPEQVVKIIAELIATYEATRNQRTTIGQTLQLLKRLRRLLIPLIGGKSLRHRDRGRRIQVLERFINSALGTYEHTFDVLSVPASNLIAHLNTARACASLAREVDGIAERESNLLRLWQKNERKVEGSIEHKRYLCGCLRVVWEHFAGPATRHSKAKRRRFITTVLDEFDVPHPDDNDYQTLDGWIEADVSKPVFAPTVG